MVWLCVLGFASEGKQCMPITSFGQLMELGSPVVPANLGRGTFAPGSGLEPILPV